MFPHFHSPFRHTPHSPILPFLHSPIPPVSEDLWVLANLTDPIAVREEGSFTRELDDRSGSRNSSNPPLFSFAHLLLAESSNFTEVFRGRREHDYTSRMWNGDVALVIRVTNLTNPMTFRVSVCVCVCVCVRVINISLSRSLLTRLTYGSCSTSLPHSSCERTTHHSIFYQ